ncbi:hypothetical protein CEXT_394811 [Caerostris extrusa]|uniref:Uncharacterized protein n=1 Tax=Caerostris extrusa TaxID=172846 RepID=A0AAV4X9S9_CAEEX|nr:hypothetical protein CEXT_394811 [Caerostris extrusa]
MAILSGCLGFLEGGLSGEEFGDGIKVSKSLEEGGGGSANTWPPLGPALSIRRGSQSKLVQERNFHFKCFSRLSSISIEMKSILPWRRAVRLPLGVCGCKGVWV